MGIYGLDGNGLQCFRKDDDIDDSTLPSWIS